MKFGDTIESSKPRAEKVDEVVQQYESVVVHRVHNDEQIEAIQQKWSYKDFSFKEWQRQGCLLTESGLPSKLSEKQYRQVRTDFFKTWFGEWQNDAESASKVVDPDTHEPMPVFHGTPFGRFNVFDKEKRSQSTGAPSADMGFFFTENMEAARKYMSPAWVGSYRYSEKESNEMTELLREADLLTSGEITRLGDQKIKEGLVDKVWLSTDRAHVEKLLLDGAKIPAEDSYELLTGNEAIKELDNKLKGKFGDVVYEYGWRIILSDQQAKIYLPITDNPELYFYGGGAYDLLPFIPEGNVKEKLKRLTIRKGRIYNAFLSLKNPLIHDHQGQRYHDEDEQAGSYAKLIQEAIEKKNDGVIILNTEDPSPMHVFVALKANQIKSSVKNSGEFDVKNEDIRF